MNFDIVMTLVGLLLAIAIFVGTLNMTNPRFNSQLRKKL